MRLSICIPTYNRAGHLANCLESIRVSRAASRAEVQVCVSDNGSTDGTERVVRAAQNGMPVQYHRNTSNLGIPRNFLNVVKMAEGDFVWLLGDDDLVVPGAVEQICALMGDYPKVEFFYVNSFHLATEHVLSFPQPFNTSNLPAGMTPFSSWTNAGELKFMDLIDPRVSFDFLGGMFLSVFKRERWLAHAGAISDAALSDERVFSCFDNTFPHVKIFSRAFATSPAFFCATPLSVCLSGAREWAPMYPMVRSVRLIQALEEYRKNGLPWLRYLRCRNHALRYFIPDLVYMFLKRDRSGYAYIRPARLMVDNCLFPNLYLSVFYYGFRKIHTVARRLGRRVARLAP